MTPSPFSAGNPGPSRGGIIDLPTPKRAANVYVGKRVPLPTGEELAALEMTSDGELPALLGDLGLDEVLDPDLLALESAGARSAPSVRGLDLSDLPAPVGPRPRSPLSTRGPTSAVSASRSLLPVSGRGPTSKPGIALEPEPLPAPPTREALAALGETLPLGAAPLGDAKKSARHELVLGRPPLGDGVIAPPAERATVPVFPPALRDTQPVPRRTSSSGLGIAKPVHSLFDASEPPPPPAAPRLTEATPPLQPLPALPSDESGGRPGSPSGAGSISDSSGPSVQSVVTGAPGTSSTATTDPKPLRLGYLIIALAVLALLLAVVIARIAGIWNKQAAAVTEPVAAAPPGESRRPPPP